MDDTLARVLALPRRAPVASELIEALSAHLRRREFNNERDRNLLRPQQVEIMREVFDLRRAVAHMPVGSGKTLPTLLLPTLLGAHRPALLLPASLREKTQRDFARYRQDWHVRLPELISYEEMCRRDREIKLFESAPDLLMADECDPLFRDNAVSRRTQRYVEVARPIYVPMSGTYIGEKVRQYAPTTALALRELAPVPTTPVEIEEWGNAVDNQIRSLQRVIPPGFEKIPGGFHAWFRGSRGVVCGRGVECNASIRVSIWQPDQPQVLQDAIQETANSGMRPDGEQMGEWELPDVLCQLALGFYYKWDPMPPQWWLRPRRAWAAYVRAVVEAKLVGFDTTSMITHALDHGSPLQPPGAYEAAQLLAAWRAVKDEFEPNPVPVWLDDTPIRQAVQQADKGCIIWCKHTTALEPKLESLGVPYYGGGRDPEQAPPGKTIACSIKAHHRGKNLQAWHRCLVTCPMAKQRWWEQLIGRFHRPGQKSPHVDVEIIGTIDYHGAVMGRVLADARAVSKGCDVPHKLVLADWL